MSLHTLVLFFKKAVCFSQEKQVWGNFNMSRDMNRTRKGKSGSVTNIKPL